jgi:type IV pilus assembly protein PilW
VNARHPARSALRNARGFSLIELMVALAVGMVLTLAVFLVLAQAEGRKRVTTGLNDLEQSGNLALYLLDQWVRSSGAGFSGTAVVDNSLYGCLLRASRDGEQTLPRKTALPAPFASVDLDGSGNFPLAPVMILPAATQPGASGKASDALIIMAGASSLGGGALSMTAAPTSTTLSLNNTLAFSPGDLLLMADPTKSSNCLLTQVSSGFERDNGKATSLTLGGDLYAATVGDTSIAGSYEESGGMLLPLGSESSNPPQFLLIGVGDHNTLYSYDLFQIKGAGEAKQARADNVFEMHALYGVDTDANGTVDKWVTATGDYSVSKLMASSGKILMKRIKAVRVGLILRTPLPEKSSDETSTAATLTLFPDLEDSGLSYPRTLSSDERQYRYRTVDATLVVRNNLVIKD